MKRLAGVGVMCLLAACMTSPAGLHQAEPDIVSEIPAVAAELSDCLYRAMQNMGSPYTTLHLHPRPDKLEFYLTNAALNNSPRLPPLPSRSH